MYKRATSRPNLEAPEANCDALDCLLFVDFVLIERYLIFYT